MNDFVAHAALLARFALESGAAKPALTGIAAASGDQRCAAVAIVRCRREGKGVVDAMREMMNGDMV